MDLSARKFLLAALVIIILGSVWAALTLYQHRRAEKLSAWARQQGWKYTEQRRDLVGHLPGHPFDRGYLRMARHVLSATYHGQKVRAFEYMYRTVNGMANRTWRTYRIVTVATPAGTPMLEIRRQHLGHHALRLVGRRDLRTGDKRFDRRFRVHATNAEFARAILAPQVRAWLLGARGRRRIPLRFTGYNLLTWKRARLDPDRALVVADHLIGVLRRVPEDAWPQPHAT